MKAIGAHWTVKRKRCIAALAVAAVLSGLVVASATPRSASPYHRLSTFAKVLSHIERLYVEPVEQDQVIFGAIRGMMRELDPHSAFLLLSAAW